MTLSAAEAEAALTATGCGRAWFDRVWLDDKSYLIGIRRCIYVMEVYQEPGGLLPWQRRRSRRWQ